MELSNNVLEAKSLQQRQFSEDFNPSDGGDLTRVQR